MKADDLPAENHRRHHRHRHRKRRFHVRPEAEGRGYWRFLGLKSRAGRAGQPEVDTDDDADEDRGWTTGTFWLAALVIACLIVAAWLFGEQFCRMLLGLSPR
jgi:hypothetical protein